MSAPSSPGPEAMTVEELSARTGAPVRTIREYQTWRILHPPTRVGRRGFYDESHVTRLDRIARLQRRGYSIAAIRDLFEAWAEGSGLRDVLGVDDRFAEPADEAPVALDAARLAALLPTVAASPELLAQAVTVGLLDRRGEGFIARSPALLHLVADAIATGRPPESAVAFAGTVVSAADQVGRSAAEELAASIGDVAPADLGPWVRRARALLAQATATHAVARAGHHLARLAEEHDELERLLADVRIGTVVEAVDLHDDGRGPGEALVDGSGDTIPR